MYRPSINNNHFKFYISSFLFIALYLLLFFNHMIDDSYITLSYAKTFAEHYIWGMKCCTISNAATSPLNVLLESFLIKIGIPALASVLVLTFFCVSFVSLILHNYVKNNIFPYYFGLILSLSLITNPWLDSTIGLEGFIVILYMFVVCYSIDFEKKYLLNISLGLSFSIRPELIIMNFIVIFYLSFEDKKYALRVFLYSSALVLSGMIISWYFLGSPLPDTFFIKKTQKSWGDYNFSNGIFLYLKTYPTATILSLIPILFVIFSIKRNLPKGIKIAFIFFPILHFASYSILKVPPYHWYYVPEITSISMLGYIGMNQIIRRVSLFYYVSVALIIVNIIFVYSYMSKSGFTPINTNWASVSQYEEVSKWLNNNTNEKEIFLWAELGVIQFYSNANMINEFSDRKILVNTEQKSSGIKKHIYKLLFKNLSVPEYQSKIEINSYLRENCREGYIKKWDISSPWAKNSSICIYKKDS